MEQANAEVGRKDVNSARQCICVKVPAAFWSWLDSRYLVGQCNAMHSSGCKCEVEREAIAKLFPLNPSGASIL